MNWKYLFVIVALFIFPMAGVFAQDNVATTEIPTITGTATDERY